MDTKLAKRNMITQQIRAWDVLDDTVLDLVNRMPREAFVPVPYQALAFADIQTPIGEGQTMLAPKEEAKILQALRLKPEETVLEIGAGTGYMAALMGGLAQQVYSVETNKALIELAKANLAKQGIHNVAFFEDNGLQGLAAFAPYNVIVLSGSVAQVPNVLFDQLKVGGRLFAIVGDAPAMRATLFEKVTKTSYKSKVLFETVVSRLAKAQEKAPFNF